MKLLILGGTIFLGRALVEAAQARGHEVTLFNRGQHNADLFPEVEKLRGNRDGDLEALKGRQWDAAIDTCGYIPRAVRDSAQLLADSVGHYTFHSSISAFADFKQPGMKEDAPLGTIEDETTEQVTGETYGPLKVLCEKAAEQAMPGRTLNIRPGLIVGPHDPSDRFTYWPCRVAKGGEVLAPDQPDILIQMIDVRDLAEWNIRMIEANKTGVYNATGPEYPLTMGRMLDECKTVSGSDAQFIWADEAFLLESEVAPWMELPLWVPASEGEGFSAIDCTKAIKDGLTFRPLTDIVRDTLEWAQTLPADRKWRAGLTPEKEQAVLEKWHQRA